MKRLFGFIVAAALIATACAGADSGVATTTASLSPPEPTSTPGSVATTTIRAPAARGAAGLGDSRYPALGNAGYDVDRYTIDLTYDPDAAAISALVTAEATATESLAAFNLDFIGYDIAAIRVNDAPAQFTRAKGELTITPDETIMQGRSFSVSVRYSGRPRGVTSQALPFVVGWRTAPDGTVYVVSEPDGAHSWIPVNDHPLDKATYSFRITVPEPLVAAANGSFVERITDLGSSTWVWETEHPMASYLATVVIGNLEIVEDSAATAATGVPVRNVLPPDLAAEPPAALAMQGEMIAFFSEAFGPYPLEAYGIAVVDGFEAALENQTLSIFGRNMTTAPQFFETVLVHELAHQWFGDSVTPADWADVWLNEGFATYAEWLWIEHRRGDAALAASISGARSQMSLSSHLPPPGNPPADDLFNASVYVRGALVLHALRSEIGDAAFFDTLHRYVAKYQDSTASTADFIAVAEEVSARNLSGLFDRWLYGETVPELP